MGWANMGAECKRLEDAGVDRIQFDVMDGNFVPNLTFGPELIAACRKYTNSPFETQLMVSNYNCDTMLDQYTKASVGPNGEPGVVIVHVEGNVHLHRALGVIRENGGSPSVAMNPHTPVEMIENVLDLVDHVLVMTVNPGFGGQAYISTMTDKIRKVRTLIVESRLTGLLLPVPTPVLIALLLDPVYLYMMILLSDAKNYVTLPRLPKMETYFRNQSKR